MIKNCEKPPLTRKQIISLLSESAKFCAYRVTSYRCKPQEGDETRLKYARYLAQIASPLLAALKDNDLDELERRLDEQGDSGKTLDRMDALVWLVTVLLEKGRVRGGFNASLSFGGQSEHMINGRMRPPVFGARGRKN